MIFRQRPMLSVLACAVLGCAAPSLAESVPPGAVMRVDRIDAAAFAQTLTARYNIACRRIVAADIDSDGDTDVVAATDAGLLIWVNDGTGRLTSQAPMRAAEVAGQPPGKTWHRRTARDQDTIQNDVPAPRLPTERSPAPPVLISKAIASLYGPHPTDCARGAASPRAPPLAP